MGTLFFISFMLVIISLTWMFTSFIYSFIIIIKQDKEFRSNIKIGDETDMGKITAIEGDTVIINRSPLRIPLKNISPKHYLANKIFFILDKKY